VTGDPVARDLVSPPNAERIILIGFMGSGKTSVGRVLAARLGWDLVDTDSLVEAGAGATVADIFRNRGEPSFRALESEVLASLRGRRSVVIATGGGAPAQPPNRDFFTGQAVFHLRVSLGNALLRARGNRDRPLLSQGEEAVRALYENRQPIYESLGEGVETDGRDASSVAEEILGRLRDPTKSRKPADSG
jgi:shikimate kinase